MIKAIVSKLALRHIRKNDPDFIIGPDKSDPYMRRWWWIPRNRFLNVYIHEFLHDDDDRAPHDHPWWSVSLLCRGNLVEKYIQDSRVVTRKICSGSVKFRSAKFAHRLIVPSQKETPVTVFVTGPVVRVWGFHCEGGWREWKTVVGSHKDGIPARGCGEVEE